MSVITDRGFSEILGIIFALVLLGSYQSSPSIALITASVLFGVCWAILFYAILLHLPVSIGHFSAASLLGRLGVGVSSAALFGVVSAVLLPTSTSWLGSLLYLIGIAFGCFLAFFRYKPGQWHHLITQDGDAETFPAVVLAITITFGAVLVLLLYDENPVYHVVIPLFASMMSGTILHRRTTSDRRFRVERATIVMTLVILIISILILQDLGFETWPPEL